MNKFGPVEGAAGLERGDDDQLVVKGWGGRGRRDGAVEDLASWS